MLGFAVDEEDNSESPGKTTMKFITFQARNLSEKKVSYTLAYLQKFPQTKLPICNYPHLLLPSPT